MPATLYHNPRCSKSRATLALIEAEGITPEIVLYLDTPLSRSDLAVLIALLEAVFGLIVPELRQAGCRLLPGGRGGREGAPRVEGHQRLKATSDPDALLDAIAANPRLMERPIRPLPASS